MDTVELFLFYLKIGYFTCLFKKNWSGRALKDCERAAIKVRKVSGFKIKVKKCSKW